MQTLPIDSSQNRAIESANESGTLRRVFGAQQKSRQVAAHESFSLAGPTGLEPATSGVTGRRSNRLNYDPAFGFRRAVSASMELC
jgi:hypothetical protein